MRSIALALTAIACTTAIAQDAPGDRPFRIGTRVDVVVAPTTVLDKSGSYVTGLKPSEFRLFDNGKQQNIRVEETFAPISMVVAIQSNATVEAVLPTIRKMGTLLQSLVAGEQGEVALVAFDHRVQLLQDFTADATKLQEALQKLKPGSSSSRMIDATIEATRMLTHRPKDRRRIILLITESRDVASAGKPREALTSLELGNVLVYALNISRVYTSLTAKAPPSKPDPIPVSARPTLVPGMPQTPTAMAQISGGAAGYGGGGAIQFLPVLTEIFRATKAIFVANPVEIFTRYSGGKERGFVSHTDLEKAVSEIGREIHNQYVISYSPNNKEEGGFHELKVVVTRPELEVRTREGYWLASVVD
jgi:VWFA-related protein